MYIYNSPFRLGISKTETHDKLGSYIFDEVEDSRILELFSPYSTDRVVENSI